MIDAQGAAAERAALNAKADAAPAARVMASSLQSRGINALSDHLFAPSDGCAGLS